MITRVESSLCPGNRRRGLTYRSGHPIDPELFHRALVGFSAETTGDITCFDDPAIYIMHPELFFL